MSDCEPFTGDAPAFPRRIHNRPGLVHVDYRVATWPEFLEALLRGLDRSVELSAWTHREPDDPGIALLEGAALVGDVLTFYQERYANEAFLRTATWRESVGKLVRLLGYRPAPGMGGRATFALEAKGDRAVEIPAGFPLKAELADLDDPVDFLTDEDVTAHPHLSRFHLYRHRSYGATIPAGSIRIEMASAGGSSSQAAIAGAAIREGERIMLVAPEPAWVASGSSFSAVQPSPQVVKVKAVTTSLGRTVLELDAPLVRTWSAPVQAYRLGRSFRHFGHTAPALHTVSVVSGGEITGASQRSTDFERHLDEHACTLSDLDRGVAGHEMPLDRQVDDLAVGGRVVIQARVTNGGSGAAKDLTAVRVVEGTRATSLGFASLTGPSTILELDAPLNENDALSGLRADVRDVQVHEVTGPPLTLRRTPTFAGGSFAHGVDALAFWGTLDEVRALAGRRLLMEKEGVEPFELASTDPADSFVLPPGAHADEPRMWSVSFDRAPQPFTRPDFDEDEPAVTVAGNLVDATQGKDQGEVTLGNGDARAAFQTFRLPKAPLTWLPAAGATPPRKPELEVRVRGRLWTAVHALFGRGPAEEVYVVREDAEGESYVQFGDGETGARLPSGVGNVTARYRTGAGAFGLVKEGAAPSAGRRVDGLDKARLPGLVTGGSEPEPADGTREAAPGRVQGLGRLVSLRDFETEVLTIGGVTSASASWGLHDGVPALLLRVLLQAGREAEFDAVRATVQTYQRCRGPDRFPVVVEQATLRYAWLDLRYAFDPRLERDGVEAAVRAALGPTDDEAASRTGLFGVRNRKVGAREYARRIEAVAQNVAGVTWCRVTGLGMFAATATEPEALALPPAPRSAVARITPAAHQVLQLHPSHLTLVSAPPPPAGECDA